MVSIDAIKQLGQPPDKIKSEYFEARVLRSVSPYLTKLLIEQGVTANQVSVFSILVLISASILMMYDTSLILVSYFLYLLIFNLLDNVDGEIARTTNTLTKTGQSLEAAQFVILLSGFFIGFSVWLYKNLNYSFLILLGVIFSFSASYVHLRGRLVIEIINKKHLKKENGPINKGKKIFKIYKKYSRFSYFFSVYRVGFIFILILEDLYNTLPGFMDFNFIMTPASIFFVIKGSQWVLLAVVTGIARACMVE